MTGPKSEFLTIAKERGYIHQTTDGAALDQQIADEILSRQRGTARPCGCEVNQAARSS